MDSKKEKLLKEAYSKLLDIGFGEGALETINQFIDDDVMGYGTAQDEKIMTIKEFRDLIINQRKQAINFDDFRFTSKPVINRISDNGNSAVIVDEIVLLTRIQGEVNELVVRMSTVFEFRNRFWKLIHWHGSKPEHISGGDDPWHVNEWKRKNEELQKLVDEKTSELFNKNKELEIEASLERVRAVAMSMHKSNDLLSICEVSFKEFQKLGFENIRNAIIHIPNDQQKYFMDYDFSEFTGEAITKIEYGSHPIVDDYLEKIRSAKDAYFEVVIDKDQLEGWKDFRNKSGQMDDPRLDEATAIYYYVFSIGVGDIGISTFKPIEDSQKKILKRFRNVFDLAYRRYNDIAFAEEQAREAQIEAALERVRSRTMGMQKSDELAETVSVLFKQLLALGVKSTQLRTCGIVTFKENEPEGEVWITDITGEIIDKAFIAPYDEAPVYKMIYSNWKKGEKFLEINLKGDDFLEHLTYVKKYSAVPNINLDEIQKSYSEIFFHVLFFSQGYLFIISYEPLPDYHDIFKRFGVLFQQTYTRFLDFKKVEAQNKIIQAENERKTKELEDARQLQLSMLPKELPKLPHLDIAVYMKTATEVGGDYYDFNVDADGSLTVLVGDATGHGMMSGMMVSIMKSFFISNRTNIELKQFFEDANNSIKDMHLGRLMMATVGVQITSQKIIATNAGMPSLLYFRNKSKKAGEFVSHNFPLGAMKNTNYSLKEIRYEKGDTLLLMSDGFAELKNEKNEQYGYERVKKEFMSVAQKNPNEIVEHLKTSATQWINGVEPDDDVTFVVIKVK